MNFLYYSSLMLFIVLAFFLTLLVLIQKGRGGGLSAAFGGVGGNTAFGAKTGDVLTWATSIVFGVFLLLAVALNLLANSIHARQTNPFADKPAAVVSPTTVPTEAARDVVMPESATPPATAAPTTTPAAVAPAALAPTAAPGGPNPKPTPPPSPTTNPSTKPTAVAPTTVAPTAVTP